MWCRTRKSTASDQFWGLVEAPQVLPEVVDSGSGVAGNTLPTCERATRLRTCTGGLPWRYKCQRWFTLSTYHPFKEQFWGNKPTPTPSIDLLKPVQFIPGGEIAQLVARRVTHTNRCIPKISCSQTHLSNSVYMGLLRRARNHHELLELLARATALSGHERTAWKLFTRSGCAMVHWSTWLKRSMNVHLAFCNNFIQREMPMECLDQSWKWLVS